MCGIILVTIPSIQFGGYFLLQILSGKHQDLALNDFQKSMFRAGHAHAGVLVILSLLAEILTDHSGLAGGIEWVVRIGFPLSAILVSGGFFGAAAAKGTNKPSNLIGLLYLGALLLLVCLMILGIALITS
jgi:hypothetical protein